MDALVRPVARGYLARLSGRDSADLMADFLEPVSIEALRSVMGLEDLVDSDTLRRWFADLNRGVSNFGLEPENFEIAARATAEIEDIVRPRLEALVRKPDESMLSHMLWIGREDGEPRPIELILPSLNVILLGGMQEPGHAAGSTLLGLLTNPEQLALTYKDPETYIPLAVHEGLRWIAPIGAVERQASRDVAIGGVKIKAGEIVMTLLGSANRDERRFDHPDEFDFDWVNRVHQAFGNGEHFCAGHFLARQVERIMLEEMLSVMDGLALDPIRQPVVNGWVFRAPKYLPVRWRASRAPSESATTVRGPVAVPDGRTATRVLRVQGMSYAAENILALDLVDPAGRELEAWEPGAHIDLSVVDSHPAHYSLCGDPADRLTWRVAILRHEDGRGVSRYVHEVLRPGDLVHVGLPRNTFHLSDAPAYHFIAGGIGVTPILSMARAAVARGSEVRITYCGRSRRAMAFVDEVRSIGDRVQLHISDEDDRLDLRSLGRATVADLEVVVACGPERMLAELETLAERESLELHTERFASVVALREGDGPFDVVLARSGTRVTVCADETILDAVERVGVEVPNVCREGNCGSCETRVVAGRADHRDVLLTPRQRRENKQAHDLRVTCSRPRTDPRPVRSSRVSCSGVQRRPCVMRMAVQEPPEYCSGRKRRGYRISRGRLPWSRSLPATAKRAQMSSPDVQRTETTAR